MLVLGIDPGSTAMGISAVRRRQGRLELVFSTVVKTTAKTAMPLRLMALHKGLEDALFSVRPDEAAIEAIFRHKSSESALRLGQARGVAVLAVAQAGLELGEYNPMTVKKTVAGHGRAGKVEVQRIVQRLLGLDQPLPPDASDAAAIAITHIHHARFQRQLDSLGRPPKR
jgi:crossover junction endodeoxyribonuclease RuvC